MKSRHWQDHDLNGAIAIFRLFLALVFLAGAGVASLVWWVLR